MPICSADDALSLLTGARRDPLEPETLLFFLDDRGIGGIVYAVRGTERPDAMIEVVEAMTGAPGHESETGVVVASVRPYSGVLPGDVDRWLEASSICESEGFVLLEWYVIGPHGAECPRDLLGEPARWR